MVAAVIASIFVGATGLGSGCGNAPRPDLGKPYPAELAEASRLDVQVMRVENRLRFTNTSGVVFGEATMWVNAAYSLPIKGLAIGQRVDLPLHDFRNEYGQRFRAGGFFATEVPSRVVKTEIVDDRGRFELVVVRDVVE